ncbi:hypothetical protein LWF01_18250 [Saxibacter everestensis]|uniref:DUF3052 domain-containing protein n=1 Tax=Saxibacter everestensis TaxID=2909229 RepID=A0ABY8QSN2_9MICO|nr:hypothetical protein LWF01_18250 [Brevibacteriaceae bacterium ZFBP1038]
MTRSVAQKMGVKEGVRTFFVNAPALALDAIELPELEISENLVGDFDYIHLFSMTRAEMNQTFPLLKLYLKPSGMLWLSWPKSRKLGSDLSLPIVIEIGYNHGLVESTCLRIDDTWAGLKFTHPKKGKVYNNSHGTLPDY